MRTVHLNSNQGDSRLPSGKPTEYVIELESQNLNYGTDAAAAMLAFSSLRKMAENGLLPVAYIYLSAFPGRDGSDSDLLGEWLAPDVAAATALPDVA